MLNKEDLNDIESLAKDIALHTNEAIACLNYIPTNKIYYNILMVKMDNHIQELKEIVKALDEIVNEKKHTIERMF